jgi:hypothetical protein
MRVAVHLDRQVYFPGEANNVNLGSLRPRNQKNQNTEAVYPGDRLPPLPEGRIRAPSRPVTLFPSGASRPESYGMDFPPGPRLVSHPIRARRDEKVGAGFL